MNWDKVEAVVKSMCYASFLAGKNDLPDKDFNKFYEVMCKEGKN